MPGEFSRDRLYARPLEELVDFSFDEKTVAVFPDMINRSVPGYSLLQSLTGLVASERVTEGSRVYDLGCSLGASSLSVLRSVGHDCYTLVMVDSSAGMIEKAREMLRGQQDGVSIELEIQDVRKTRITGASMVILNLVLQFLPVEDRQAVLDRVYAGLDRNGAVLVAEKTVQDDHEREALVQELYRRFKKRAGYSDLEISQKRRALERVMRIENLDAHAARLRKAGFRRVVPLFRALNFAALMAVK